jgi:hypothetical protein
MSLLFMDGFDAGDIAAKWSIASGTWNYTASTRFGSGGAASVGSAGTTLKSFTASAQIFLGCAVLVSNLTNRTLFTLRADSGSTVHLKLVAQVDGSLALQRNTTTIATTSPASITQNVWSYLETSATIADAGGVVQVKVNGTTVLNFTGDTRNAGTSTNIDTFVIGEDTSIVYDDLYICNGLGSAPYNTFLGDVRINTLVPTGAGSSTGFAPSAGANYTDVDELPFSASDYVSATASGTRDLYAMSDVMGSYSVLAVQNNVVAKKTDAGGTAIKPAVKSGGTVYYGSNTTLTATDATISDLRTTDPATGVAWTQSNVNALEAGMEIV